MKQSAHVFMQNDLEAIELLPTSVSARSSASQRFSRPTSPLLVKSPSWRQSTENLLLGIPSNAQQAAHAQSTSHSMPSTPFEQQSTLWGAAQSSALYGGNSEASTSSRTVTPHLHSYQTAQGPAVETGESAESDISGEAFVPILSDTQIYEAAADEDRTQATLSRWSHQERERRAREREDEARDEDRRVSEYERQGGRESSAASPRIQNEQMSVWSRPFSSLIDGARQVLGLQTGHTMHSRLSDPIPHSPSPLRVSTSATPTMSRDLSSGSKGKAPAQLAQRHELAGLNPQQLRFDAYGEPVSAFERPKLIRSTSSKPDGAVQMSRRVQSSTEADIAKAIHSELHEVKVSMEEGRLRRAGSERSEQNQTPSRKTFDDEQEEKEGENKQWFFDYWLGLGKSRTREQTKQGGWTNPME